MVGGGKAGTGVPETVMQHGYTVRRYDTAATDAKVGPGMLDTTAGFDTNIPSEWYSPSSSHPLPPSNPTFHDFIPYFKPLPPSFSPYLPCLPPGSPLAHPWLPPGSPLAPPWLTPGSPLAHPHPRESWLRHRRANPPSEKEVHQVHPTSSFTFSSSSTSFTFSTSSTPTPEPGPGPAEEGERCEA